MQIFQFNLKTKILLFLAVINLNAEIVQLLLKNEKLDVNHPYILSYYYFT